MRLLGRKARPHFDWDDPYYVMRFGKNLASAATLDGAKAACETIMADEDGKYDCGIVTPDLDVVLYASKLSDGRVIFWPEGHVPDELVADDPMIQAFAKLRELGWARE